MTNKGSTTIVATVTTIISRDNLIKRIYTNLTKEPSDQFIIQQDRINRIRVFHKGDEGVLILIRTYLVIVIPIIMDLSPLYELEGIVDFRLDKTIDKLTKLINTLRSLQGRKIMKGKTDGKTLEQLVNSLHGTDVQY